MIKILIVGGVAGGASAAARLRRLDENLEIILFERGQHISFANCGLPYYVGGIITDENDLLLQTPESFHSRFRVDVRVSQEVLSINPQEKNITVKNHTTGELYTENYDKLLLSPGAEPIVPNILGIESDRVFTLRSIPDTFKITDFMKKSKPKSAVVVGGGFIGIEMAENLHQAGLKTTVVEMSGQIMPPLDPDMAAYVEDYMRYMGIDILLNNGVTGISEGVDSLDITLQNGAVSADILIMAVGVKPESKLAKEAGLKVNPRGCIVVNSFLETSSPDIYAVGDAIEVEHFVSKTREFIPLAGPANKQGRIVAGNMLGQKKEYKGTQGSSIMKIFALTVASTGINEKMAAAQGLDYDKIFTLPLSHADYYPGATRITIKTIFEIKSGKILGAQLCGFEGVDKRCDVLATAIRGEMTSEDLAELELCYAPPYSSAKDPVNMVGYVIENIMDGTAKQFHWHDLKSLQQSNGVALVDIRTPEEYAKGTIPGFINIPVDDLRERMDELDKLKPVYLTCQSGVRGYIGARILAQHGFSAYNLSGGYLIYQITKGLA